MDKRKLFMESILGNSDDKAYSVKNGKSLEEYVQEIANSDIVTYKSGKKCILRPGYVYIFKSGNTDYKVQLYTQDGGIQSGWNGNISPAASGIILYPSSDTVLYIGIKGKPSILQLLDFIETSGFSVNKEKPDIYLETVDNNNFLLWEIGMHVE